MTDLRLIRVRMVKEFVYCPRQACMMWVPGEFNHSADSAGKTSCG